MHWSKKLKLENRRLREENAALKAEIAALNTTDLDKMAQSAESDNVIHVDTLERITASTMPAIVAICATWCPPCRRLKPVLAEIAAEDTRYDVMHSDVDERPQIASYFGVRGLPTLLFIKNGNEVGRITGGVPREYLEQEAKRYLL